MKCSAGLEVDESQAWSMACICAAFALLLKSGSVVVALVALFSTTVVQFSQIACLNHISPLRYLQIPFQCLTSLSLTGLKT